MLDIENKRAEIGSTLNPALRFFVFDTEPNMDRLMPPAPEPPMPAPAPVTTARAIVERIFWRRWGVRHPRRSGRWRKRRSPTRREPGTASPDAVADLLWAILMKPEFQLMY